MSDVTMLAIDPSISAEGVQIICRLYIRIFLKNGAKTRLCQAHSTVHPELHQAMEDPVSTDKGVILKHVCVLCGAGLKEHEDLSVLPPDDRS